MTNKEILLSAIALEKTPRTPVVLLSSGVWTFKRFGLSLQDAFTMPPERIADAIISNAKVLDLDLVWTAADLNNIVLKALGAKTTFHIAGSAGTVDAPLIREIDDIDSLRLDDIENSPDIQNLLKVTQKLKEALSDDYLIGTSQWGPLTLAGQMIGIEKMMKLIIKDKPGAEKLLDFAGKVILKYLTLFQQSGAELLCLSEPSASGDMISGRLFETFALPHLQSLYAAVGTRAKMLHICGNTSNILKYIPLTGANLFSFDYKVTVSDAAQALGGRMAFAGQLPPVAVMLEGTPADVLQTARACIDEAHAVNGYVLMPGCDLPPKTKVENVLAMVKAAHTFPHQTDGHEILMERRRNLQ